MACQALHFIAAVAVIGLDGFTNIGHMLHSLRRTATGFNPNGQEPGLRRRVGAAVL